MIQSKLFHVLRSQFPEAWVGGAVRDKDLKVLLNLVNLALQRIPKMVRDDRGATVMTIFSQILPLLAEERLQ
jgi:hypothetical protein